MFANAPQSHLKFETWQEVPPFLFAASGIKNLGLFANAQVSLESGDVQRWGAFVMLSFILDWMAFANAPSLI